MGRSRGLLSLLAASLDAMNLTYTARFFPPLCLSLVLLRPHLGMLFHGNMIYALPREIQRRDL